MHHLPITLVLPGATISRSAALVLTNTHLATFASFGIGELVEPKHPLVEANPTC